MQERHEVYSYSCANRVQLYSVYHPFQKTQETRNKKQARKSDFRKCKTGKHIGKRKAEQRQKTRKEAKKQANKSNKQTSKTQSATKQTNSKRPQICMCFVFCQPLFGFWIACFLFLTVLFVACVGWPSFRLFEFFFFSDLFFNVLFFVWMAFGHWFRIILRGYHEFSVFAKEHVSIRIRISTGLSAVSFAGRTEDWMKSFFENNRAYFEKQGLAQKLKKQDMKGPFCSRERKWWLTYKPDKSFSSNIFLSCHLKLPVSIKEPWCSTHLFASSWSCKLQGTWDKENHVVRELLWRDF